MAEQANSIEVWRIYATDDGSSSMQRMHISLDGDANGGWVGKLLKGTGVIGRRYPPGLVIDWHNAPRRQLIATLSGTAEIETGDGQVLKVTPGTIELVEDLQGKGHITRIGTNGERVCLFLPLDPDTRIDA